MQPVGAGNTSAYEPPHLTLRQQQQQSQPQQPQQSRHLLDAGNQRTLGVVQSSSGSDLGGQPVEFDHAISYVNKIKVNVLILLSYCPP